MGVKKIEILLNEDQIKIIERKVKETGFSRRSEYIRFVLLMGPSFFEKIDAIYNRVVKNG